MNKKVVFSLVIGMIAMSSLVGCSKSSDPATSLYVPSAADVTANATLAQLQEGRALYVSHCASCHSLYNPDNYSASSWRSYVAKYGSRAGLTPAQETLVGLYGTRGK